jgi:histone-lysine N-methyltransferase SETD3
MGRRGQKKGAKGGEKSKEDVFSKEELLDALYQPMPPNKRNELNGIVEKLLNLSSNFTHDDPSTPAKLFVEFEEIYAMVQKVRSIEQQANMNRRLPGSRRMHVKPFLAWLEKYGGKIDGVEIDEFGTHGLGLKVSKELKKGDVVISIPRKVFMSTETAKDSSLSALIEKDPMLQRMPNVSLALHLLVEKNSPASFWEPYINMLPSSYTTVMYFTPDDFKEMRGSPALEDALKQFKYVARQYAYFYRKFQSMILRDYFTFDEYRWAVSTVMTRQNQVFVLYL